MADPDVSREQQGEACRFVELDRDRIFAHHSVVAVGKINAVGVAAVVVVVVLVDDDQLLYITVGQIYGDVGLLSGC